MAFTFFIFASAFVIVLWAGRILPNSLSRISRILHLSQFLTAFLLVSLATSVPELFIGITSAVQGIPSLSLGNVLGANFVNLTIVIGFSVLIGGSVVSDGKISSQNFWLIFVVSLIPILLATDGIISRGDGFLLLLAFGLYILKIFRDQQYFHRHLDHTGELAGLHSISNVMKEFFRFLGGIVALLLGSFALIVSAREIIGEYFNSEFLFFGAVFLALGTALPELIFGIRTTVAGRGQAMLGNALGTMPFNAAAIVGLVSLIKPIQINFTTDLFLTALFLVLAFLAFHLFVYTQGTINRKEALVLILLYALFLIANFSI